MIFTFKHFISIRVLVYSWDTFYKLLYLCNFIFLLFVSRNRSTRNRQMLEVNNRAKFNCNLVELDPIASLLRSWASITRTNRRVKVPPGVLLRYSRRNVFCNLMLIWLVTLAVTRFSSIYSRGEIRKYIYIYIFPRRNRDWA